MVNERLERLKSQLHPLPAAASLPATAASAASALMAATVAPPALSPEQLRMVRATLLGAGVTPVAAAALLAVFDKPKRWTWLKAAANLSGFIGLQLMSGQAIMGSRFPVIERFFGFDKIMHQHRQLGIYSMGLVGVHVLHKAWGKPLAYLLQLRSLSPLVYGRLAFYGMLLFPTMALLQRYPGGKGYIPWQVWKPAHLTLYAVLGAAYWHSYKMSIARRAMPRRLWGAMLALTSGVTLWRATDLILRDANKTWKVAQVVPLTYDTTRVVLEHARLRPPREMLARRAGQFVILRRQVRGPGGIRMWSEFHPFTLSGGPDGPQIQVTIKAMPGGKFTTRVKSWQVGDRILVEGPYGIFTPDLEREQNIVMVAGGVGVTPYLSILRAAHARKLRTGNAPNLTLFWGIKDWRDLMLTDELNTMQRDMPSFTLILVFSNKNALSEVLADREKLALVPLKAQQTMYQGFMTSKIFSTHAQPFGATFYHCGPPIMAKFMIPMLAKTFSVPRDRIRYEYFSW